MCWRPRVLKSIGEALFSDVPIGEMSAFLAGIIICNFSTDDGDEFIYELFEAIGEDRFYEKD